MEGRVVLGQRLGAHGKDKGMLANRRRRRADKRLRWKAGFLIAGIALILLGNRLELAWLVWVAIGVLAVGFVLRFLPERTTDGQPEDSRERDG